MLLDRLYLERNFDTMIVCMNWIGLNFASVPDSVVSFWVCKPKNIDK